MPDINFPNSPSGGDTYTYNNITFAYDGEKWTAKGGTTNTDQTLSAAGNVITISGNNDTVDLTTMLAPFSKSDSQDLTISGNVISLSGQSGNVDLTSLLASAGGGTDSQDITLAGNVISLTGQSGNIDLTTLLNTQPTAVTADSTDGTALVLNGGNASGLNSTGGNVNINSGTGALQNGYVNIGQSSQGVYIGANSSTAINVTGPLTVNNQLIIEDGVSEKFSSLTGATGVVAHDCDNGHIFYHTSISADFTANFTNLGLSTNYSTNLTLILNQGATARIPSAVQINGSAQTINWQGGSAPSGTSNGIDAVSFTILRVSGSYIVLGQLVDFT